MKNRSLIFTLFFAYALLVTVPIVAMAEGADDAVRFRGNQASFNTRYEARIVQGTIQAREKRPATKEGSWITLTLPEGLAGQVTELAMDDEHIIALNEERQIYTMWNGLDEISDFTWQMEWGMPFWRGPGMRLTDDILTWDFSVVSRREDGYWTDPVGHLFEVGLAKCSHIWMLGKDGQELIYNDPWLPADYSYGICGPARGAFQAVNLSTSGSHLFLINKYGDMYTRFYDFDIGGADAFLPSAYADQSNKLIPVIQIPSAWVRHPKIDGEITQRISIHKIGRDCVNRTLRVEGRDGEGQTGYFEKDITQLASPSQWTFHPTGAPLEGALLDNRPEESTHLTLGPRNDRYYEKTMESVEELSPTLPWWRIIAPQDWAAELTNFSCYNTPTDLVVHLSATESLSLKLHTKETIRVSTRPRGLSHKARYIPGSIEIPKKLLDRVESLPVKSRKFIQSYLMKRRFTRVDIQATLDKVTITGTAGGLLIVWTFEHPGDN